MWVIFLCIRVHKSTSNIINIYISVCACYVEEDGGGFGGCFIVYKFMKAS